MQTIRQFVKGSDESAWVKVLNSAYKEYSDWRAITLQEFLAEEAGSSFRSDERFVADIDGQPVGVLRVCLEDSKNGAKGLIETLAIVPEFRYLGIEERLVEIAVDEVRKKGTHTIQIPRLRWSRFNERGGVEFLEKLGFALIRKTSLLAAELASIPSDIEVNTQTAIRRVEKDSTEDVELLSWLRNECSEEEFNYRQTTIEETRSLLLQNPFSYLECHFAVYNSKPVGYVVVAVDGKYNVEKRTKTGIILGVGVLKSHRTKGIGTRLVLQGLETLRALGMTRAALDVDDFNQSEAKELYEKVGFGVIESYLTYEMDMLHAQNHRPAEQSALHAPRYWPL
jgi:ribosomal protein S18 acetylase RimI-like enzyme